MSLPAPAQRTLDQKPSVWLQLNSACAKYKPLNLGQWSKAWLLPFNEKKCNILRVGRARSPNHMAYCLNGIPLQEVDSQKDLGVWITTSLKPSLHCTKIAKSAMSVLYLVKRAFYAFDEDCFAKVFRTFVRPQLEFAIQAWRPWTAKDLSILERVQRRATKLVAGQGSLPYATRQATYPGSLEYGLLFLPTCGKHLASLINIQQLEDLMASGDNITVEARCVSCHNPRSNRPERRTALVARELARYKVDIAALSETRFSEQGQLEEVGAGYTFFWSGRPRAERRDAGVAFAIRNDIVG
nr:unnamed protein product [Spirometra erinaceieuropaei]